MSLHHRAVAVRIGHASDVYTRARELAHSAASLPLPGKGATSHEDVRLIERLEQGGFRIAWSARPCVTTSARLDFRAPQGFGARLLSFAQASATG